MVYQCRRYIHSLMSLYYLRRALLKLTNKFISNLSQLWEPKLGVEKSLLIWTWHIDSVNVHNMVSVIENVFNLNNAQQIFDA